MTEQIAIDWQGPYRDERGRGAFDVPRMIVSLSSTEPPTALIVDQGQSDLLTLATGDNVRSVQVGIDDAGEPVIEQQVKGQPNGSIGWLGNSPVFVRGLPS